MLKVAVIGVGNIGNIHAPNYKSDPLSELVAVCDIIPERADKAAAKYGVRAYYSVEDLLRHEHLDAVSICAAGIENGYTLKIVNKTDRAQRYRITFSSDAAGLALREAPTVDVAAGSVASQPLTLVAPAGTRGRHALHFEVSALDGKARETVDSSFFGPL